MTQEEQYEIVKIMSDISQGIENVSSAIAPVLPKVIQPSGHVVNSLSDAVIFLAHAMQSISYSIDELVCAVREHHP